MNLSLLVAAVALVAASAAALPFIADRRDVAVRAARTFVQTAFTALLAAVTADGLEVGVVLNVIVPALTAGAAVVHGRLQPAVK